MEALRLLRAFSSLSSLTLLSATLSLLFSALLVSVSPSSPKCSRRFCYWPSRLAISVILIFVPQTSLRFDESAGALLPEDRRVQIKAVRVLGAAALSLILPK